MKHILPDDMLEATRLTIAGRLGEATAVLQRLLNGQEAPAGSSTPAGRHPTTIDGVAEAVGTATARLAMPAAPMPAAGIGFPPAGRAKPAVKPPLPEVLPNFLDQVSHGGFQLPGGGLAHPLATQVPIPVPDGAQFLAMTFNNEAGSRPYKLYVPSGYRGQPVPLIVMLHGCTQSPDDFAAGTRMNEAAEEHTCLIAYPGQTSAANMQKCWNWFSEADQQREAGEPSLIAGITREVIGDYAVDPRRIYVAGLSAGGAAAAVMADTYPEVYAAIGVHSGLACGAARDLTSAVAAMQQGGEGFTQRVADASASRVQLRVIPAIVFHGDLDSTVHPRNGDAVVAQSAQDAVVAAHTEQGQVPGGHAYTRTLHTDARGQTVIEQWVIHGAGHAWSGGSTTGSYTDPRGPDASEAMVRFFLEHPHPATT
ncbi:MAG: PHB depolymerase family esterase [Rhodopila sp.]